MATGQDRIFGSIRPAESRSSRFGCSSDVAFALATSLAWLLLYNGPFWRQTIDAMWHPSLNAVLFLGSLVVLVLFAQAMLLLLMPARILMRVAASALFIVAAAGSFFADRYGVVMNKDMLRNVAQTDLAEASAFITPDFALHMLLLGLLPAVLVWRISLPRTPRSCRLKRRVIAILAGLAACVAGPLAASADYAVFLREYKPIRFTLSPAAPVSSAIGLATTVHGGHDGGPVTQVGGTVQRLKMSGARPLVLFLVVGETARAANFALGGYARPTNPRLAGIENLVYFDRSTSCATSTAISVPCMFSHLGRSQFDVDEADRYTNLLDALVAAGFDVEWRENNAGCKGVCRRVAQVAYSERQDAQLCPNSYCYDEVVLSGLSEKLRALTKDTVIVFHQIGSHGPGYFERYPPEFERFRPACRSNELQRCTPQEVVNAYDNSIAYTDHVLARQIALLREFSDRVDSVLIYMSDHGESLGEQGIYLHGLPYSFAPRFQTEVPLIVWTSESYARRTGLRVACARARAHEVFTHDNLYHTVLGAVQAHNSVYDARQDILASCRDGGYS